MSEVRINSDTAAEPSARTDQKEGTSGEILTPTDKPAVEQKAPEENKKKYAGKYESVEALEAAYLEAQKKISGKPTTKVEPTAEAATAAVENAGLDLATLNAELAENDGELSKKTLETLKAKGISADLAKAFVEGQKARTTQLQNALAEQVGGTEQLSEVIKWAATGVSKEVAAMYNAAVDSGNVEGAKALLESIQARHAAAVGKDPTFVGGATSGARGSDLAPYASSMEMVRDMNNPLYQSDPAFRAKVQARVAKTK